MHSGFTVPAWCKPFEKLHDMQLDHPWKPPGHDKFSKDRSDFYNMPYSIKKRYKGVTHLLTRMEPEIVENAEDIQSLCKKVLPKDILTDLQIMFIMIDTQKSMEGIHIRSYGAIDDVLCLDLETKDIEQFNTFIQAKVDVISKWRSIPDTVDAHMDGKIGDMVEKASLQRRALSRAIIGNVFSEGLVFNTLFSFFSIPKKEGILQTTCITNDEVLTDENIHAMSFIKIYNILTTKDNGLGDVCIPRLEEKEVHKMVQDFIYVDDKTSDWLLGNMNLEEKDFFLIMTPENAKKYTRVVANCVLKALGYKPLFEYTKKDNPYPFIKQSLIHSLGFFFDKDQTEYGLAVDHPYESDSDPEDE